MGAAADVDDMPSFSSRLPGERIKHPQLTPIREVWQTSCLILSLIIFFLKKTVAVSATS
jgi:hypothetical protein